MSRPSRVSTVAMGVWVALSAAVAAAQSTGAPVPESTGAKSDTTASEALLDEIIVTAQKRAENVREVPISISAFSGATLEKRPVANLQDFTALVPTFRVTEPGNVAVSALSLRGVGQRDINVHNEGAVALFVDGAYVSFIPSVGQPLYDLERVEVLKGPQGTLFGRNATGGLISVISKRPSQQFDSYVTAQYASFSDRKIEGAIGGGLSDTVSARASVFYNKADGFVKNNNGPALNAVDSLGVRLQLLYQPNDDFNVLFGARTFQAYDGPGAGIVPTPFIKDATGTIRSPANYAEYSAFCAALNPIGPPPPGAELNGSCFASQPDRYRGTYGTDVRWWEKYYAGTATAEWKLSDSLSLTSISDYQHMKMDYVSDIDATAAPLFNYAIAVPYSKQFSQEIRLNGESGEALTWVTGLYYLNIRHHINNDVDLLAHPAFGIDLLADYFQKTRSAAAFAQADWKLAPQWKLSVGARVMHDKKELDNNSTCVSNPLAPPGLCDILGTFVFPGALAFNRSFSGEISDNSWSGRLVLQYDPTDHSMFYAGVTRGTKGGGFNSGAAEFYPLSAVEFKPETLTNYEAGMKVAILDPRLTIDGSVFHYDYKNYQSYSISADGGLRVLNVDAVIDGAELALNFRPIEGLSISAGPSYLSTRQKDVPLGTGQFQDFQVPDAPKWSGSGEVRYVAKMGEAALGMQVNATYVGERSISAIDYSDQRIPSYTRLDARIDYTSADGHWTVAGFGNNLTDKVIVATRVDFTTVTGNSVDTLERPRWFGASVTYRY